MKISNSDEILWHYCNLEAFYNIIKTHSIRLNDVYQSNDYTENEGFYKLVREQIYNKLSHPGLDIDQKALIDYLIRTMDNKSYIPSNNFCFCLTDLDDSPFHWSLYGDNGKGIAIGFRRSMLTFHSELSDELSISLLDMNYDTIEFQNQIDEFIEKSKMEFFIAKNKNINEAICNKLDQDLEKIYESAICYKNKRLNGECESRLSIVYKNPSDLFIYEQKHIENEEKQHFDLLPIDDYCAGNRIKSYYTLSWRNQLNTFIPNGTFPIAKIRIGYDCQMSEENIKSFVTNQITLLKAKYEYKHLPSAIKEANGILGYSNMNNTNINTDINYLRAREGLDIDIKRSELPLRNE